MPIWNYILYLEWHWKGYFWSFAVSMLATLFVLALWFLWGYFHE